MSFCSSRWTWQEQKFIIDYMRFGHDKYDAMNMIMWMRKEYGYKTSAYNSALINWEREHAPIAYLIYRYKDSIKVKQGRWGHNFYPTNPNDKVGWHTGLPERAYEITTKGRIIVLHEDDIPEAVEALKAYYILKKGDVIDHAIKSIKNLDTIIMS